MSVSKRQNHLRRRCQSGATTFDRGDLPSTTQSARTDSTTFDQTDLLALAGPRVFNRGQTYFEQGHVIALLLSNEQSRAWVFGERPYRVTLACCDNSWHAECDCPIGKGRGLCKHAVALGLAWLHRHNGPPLKDGNRLLEFVIHTLMSLEHATKANADWLQCVQVTLEKLLDQGQLRTALKLIEQSLLMQAEAQRLPNVNLVELARLEDMLCQFHQIVCQRDAISLATRARRLLKLQLGLVGEGIALTPFGEKLARLNAEVFGNDWAAAYQKQSKEFWATLATLEDAKLNLVQRRQRVWLAQSLQMPTPQASHSDQATLPTEGSEKSAGNSDLVQNCLAAGNLEAAWQAAQAGGCSDALWLRLTSMRARQYPAESLIVYQRLIRRACDRKDGYSAQQAFKLLPIVRRLLQRLSRIEEFDEFVSSLVERYGHQRTFRHRQSAK